VQGSKRRFNPDFRYQRYHANLCVAAERLCTQKAGWGIIFRGGRVYVAGQSENENGISSFSHFCGEVGFTIFVVDNKIGKVEPNDLP
jgi:hypothetical protein